MVKITRDAEMDIDDIDLSKSYIKKVSEYVNRPYEFLTTDPKQQTGYIL